MKLAKRAVTEGTLCHVNLDGSDLIAIKKKETDIGWRTRWKRMNHERPTQY